MKKVNHQEQSKRTAIELQARPAIYWFAINNIQSMIIHYSSSQVAWLGFLLMITWYVIPIDQINAFRMRLKYDIFHFYKGVGLRYAKRT